MIKKHKELYIYMSFIIIFIMTLVLCCINSNASLISSDQAFLAPNNGKDMLNNTLDQMGSYFQDKCVAGMAGCFKHNANGAGINTTIQTIIDIKVDNNGKIVVESWNSNKEHEIKPLSGNSVLGNLAAYSITDNAGIGVLRWVREATNKGYIVKNGTIAGTLQTDISDGAHSYRGSNKPQDAVLKAYSNYQQLTKETTEAGIKGKITRKQDNKVSEYIVLGPFKMNFAGKDIESVTVSASYGRTQKYDLSSEKIRWLSATGFDEIKNKSYEQWNALNASNNKGINSANGKKFFLAVLLEDSNGWVRNNGTAKLSITITQKGIDFKTSRIAIGNNDSVSQMGGLYAYNKNNQSIKGQANWVIEDNIEVLGNITIKKQDMSGNKIAGAKYVIYFESNVSAIKTGWLTGTSNGKKGTVENVEDCKVYGTSSEYKLSNLPLGTYYIFEIKAPNGFDLGSSKQHNQSVKVKNKNISPKDKYNDWVYIGCRTIIEENYTGSSKDIVAVNAKLGAIQIQKMDYETAEPLAGAEFKIYADLSEDAGGLDNTESGWLNGGARSNKEYKRGVENATTYKVGNNGLADITKLKYGTYYIYETKAPEDYNIKKQDNYKKAPDTENIENPGEEEDKEWVYCGCMTIKDFSKNTKPLKATIKNKDIVESARRSMA